MVHQSHGIHSSSSWGHSPVDLSVSSRAVMHPTQKTTTAPTRPTELRKRCIRCESSRYLEQRGSLIQLTVPQTLVSWRVPSCSNCLQVAPYFHCKWFYLKAPSLTAFTKIKSFCHQRRHLSRSRYYSVYSDFHSWLYHFFGNIAAEGVWLIGIENYLHVHCRRIANYIKERRFSRRAGFSRGPSHVVLVHYYADCRNTI